MKLLDVGTEFFEFIEILPIDTNWRRLVVCRHLLPRGGQTVTCGIQSANTFHTPETQVPETLDDDTQHPIICFDEVCVLGLREFWCDDRRNAIFTRTTATYFVHRDQSIGDVETVFCHG